MRDSKRLLVLCLVTAALLVGCDEVKEAAGLSGTGGTTTVDSGVSEQKKVSDMTADDVQKLCAAYGTAALNAVSKQAACRVTATGVYGLSSGQSGDASACETAYTACLLAPVDVASALPAGFAPCPLTSTPPSTCNATVGEYEACLSSSLVAFKGTWDAFAGESCASTFGAGASGVPSVPSGDQVDQCKSIATDCPVGSLILGQDASSTSDTPTAEVATQSDNGPGQ